MKTLYIDCTNGVSGMMFMEGQLTAETEARGTRDTGRGGLRMYIIET